MKSYFTSIIPSKKGGYTCWFLDFPEAFTQGEDLENAVEMAEDVLRIWAEDYEPMGKKKLPKPSTLEEVKRFTEEKINEGKEYNDLSREVHYQLIKLPNLDTKPVRIQVSLPANILEEIDKKADMLGITRSKLLANGALAYSL